MVEPIACTLEQPQLQDRMRTWSLLGTGSPEASADGVRLTYPPDTATAHRLLDLVAAERTCCGWAEWTLTCTSRSIRLEVVADGAGPGALHVMFGVSG